MRCLGCLQLIIAAILIILDVVHGWEVHISPVAQHLQNRKSGENFVVICSVTGLQKGLENRIEINWFRRNEKSPIERLQRIAVSKVRPLSARLLFIKPTIDDTGEYNCRAHLDANIKEKTAKISFIQAAEFVNVELEQHPEEGQDAMIICRVRGDPSMEIFWQFEGKNIMEGGPRDYELREKNQVLYIPKYRSERDDGQYTCSAAQFYSFETVVINVQAYARPQITVLEGLETSEGYEGHDFVIRCQAVGKPRPEYQWFKNTAGDQEKIIPSAKFVIKDGELIIRKLIPADSGLYICAAMNAVGEARMDFNLTVFRKARIKAMRNLTRNRGDTVELMCEFTGDGNIHAKWFHLGQQWGGSDTRKEFSGRGSFIKHDDIDNRLSLRYGDGFIALKLFSIDEDGAGEYQCVAENEAGSDYKTVFLAIIHAATIVDHSGVVRVVRGFAAELKCEASAVPEPLWTWLGPRGAVIYADGSKYIVDTRLSLTTLKITAAEKYDFGNYTCMADNGVGPPDKAIMKVVEIKPPDVPRELNCHERVYPNFGVCRFGALSADDPGRLPTNITVLVEEDEVKDDSSFGSPVMNLTYGYKGENEFKIYHLKPKSTYKVRVLAANEAGTSDFTVAEFFETTEPWAPDAPGEIRYDCAKACKVYWSAPNDRGSRILSYKLVLKEINKHRPDGYEVESYEMDIGADEFKADLPFLKPHTAYEVRVIAVNAVGNSSAHSIVLKTSEHVEDSRWNVGNNLVVIILALVLLVISMFIIDVICCYKNNWGLMAMFCTKCFHRELRTNTNKNNCHNDRSENNCLLNDEKKEKNDAMNLADVEVQKDQLYSTSV